MPDTKFFTLLVFSAINFCILFLVKTRTSLVISMIVAHLVAILFFSLSISNYIAFKEITLALIIYSLVILFLISNYGSIVVDSKEKGLNIFAKLAICFVAAVAFFLIFAAVKTVNVAQVAKVETVEQNQVIPSYEMLKKDKLRENLADNFLLKRSSDVILIIIAASTLLLLLSRKKQ